MIIKKVLNNNVVVSVNDEKKEIIVMGCGIAFQKKSGDILNKDKIEKIFVLDDKNMTKQFQELLSEVPIEYMTITDKIVKYTEEKFKKKLNDIIYISITDHIYSSVERYLKGIELKNGLLWDIKRLYKDEFEIGKYALQVIKDEIKVELPEDEAAFIATHIVNAQLNEGIPSVMNMTKLIQEILNIVKYHFRIDLDEESLDYYRFITHLKFFAQRLFNEKTHENNKDSELFNIVKEKYSSSYECIKKVSKFIEDKYSYELTNEEQLYLIIHIERLVEKHK